MVFINKIIKELSNHKKDLFKTFFPKSRYNFNFKNISKFKKFNTIVIIGMGGSILGAKSIYYFLRHKIDKKIIFIDNLDEAYLKRIKKENNLKKVLFLIISKSGNTTETIINSGFFSTFINKNNTIIISEEKNNILYNFAKNKKIYFIRHNPNIGGRYSVFSDVGMLPIYLMNLNPEKFKKNLPKLIKKQKLLKNFKNIKKINNRTKVLVLFNYIPELSEFMFWSQQLLAESLGKNKKGFIPVVSNAPKDHHSLLQLYLDGPNDKFFYIFSSDCKSKLKVNSNIFGKKMKYLNQKKYENIKLNQKKAFIKVLQEKKIQYKEIIIRKYDETTIGELFFLFILETLLLSKILKVNPYNQPAVERVKILTKKFLT